MKLFDFITANKIYNSKIDVRQIHAHTVIVLSTGVLMWAYAFLAWFTISSPVAGIVGFIFSTIHILSPFLFRYSSNAFLISSIMLAAGLIHQATFSFYTGGFRSHLLIWFGILPMLGGIISGRKGVLMWAFLTLTVSMTFLIVDLTGFVFPYLISYEGDLIAHALLVFGWIKLSSVIIYVVLILNAQKERTLSEQRSEIDTLFRVLFHDLGSPLGRLTAGISMIQKNKDQARMEKGLEIASQAAQTMAQITQNVRKIYAVNKGKDTLSTELTSLNSVIEKVETNFSEALQIKDITFKYDYQKNHGIQVQVEPISFQNQVLGNLLSNAIKFSPSGSVISIDTTTLSSNIVQLEIKDSGVGIPAQMIESLFDINKRTSRPGTRGEFGTGIGLHIVKSFIDMYQGTIEVESSEAVNNSGTTFRLNLKGKRLIS